MIAFNPRLLVCLVLVTASAQSQERYSEVLRINGASASRKAQGMFGRFVNTGLPLGRTSDIPVVGCDPRASGGQNAPALKCGTLGCPFGSTPDDNYPCTANRKPVAENPCGGCVNWYCNMTPQPICCGLCSWDAGNYCYGCHTAEPCTR
jgi:hypothetical protein